MFRFFIIVLLFVELVPTWQQLAPPSHTYVRTLLDSSHHHIRHRQEIWNEIWPLLSPSNFNNFINFSSADVFLRNSSADECLRDIETILFSTVLPSMKAWALKYVDSWAKPPAGIKEGNFAWFGDFDECLAIETSVPIGNRTISPQYCRIALSPSDMSNQTQRDQTLLQLNPGMSFGICVSTACNAEALSQIVSKLLPSKFGLYLDPASTSCQLIDPPMTKYSYFAFGILSVLGLVMLVGFILDVRIRLHKWAIDWRKTVELTTSSSLTNLIENGAINNPDSNTSSANQSHGAENNPGSSTLSRKMTRLLICFSPYSNFAKLLVLPPHSERIPNLSALHSIRALSIFWVILGHCYVFGIASLDNVFVVLDWQKRFNFQIIMSGFFAVDSFFFLSGFFAYYSLSRHYDLVKRNENSSGGWWFWKSLPSIYLHRFLRITPPYLAIIMIEICLWRHLSNGPFYFQGHDEVCLKHWWKNILYVSNFLGFTEQCIAWGWYLAVDMQLFVFLAPFFVALFVWRPSLGWMATFLALLGQTAVTVWVTYFYTLPSSLFAPQGPNQTLPALDGRPSTTTYYFESLYIKPYCRLSPYVIGIVFGHIVVRHSLSVTRRIFSKPALLVPIWFLFISSLLALIYGLYGINSGRYTNPLIVDAFYNSFARTAWAITLGWLVLALVVNRAGPIGRLLTWQGWALPARLSYTAYLTHPLILIFVLQTARRPMHGTDMTMVFFFFANLVATFIISALFSLIFESPIIAIQRTRSTVASAGVSL